MTPDDPLVFRPPRFERFLRMVLWPAPAEDPEVERSEPWARDDPGAGDDAPFTTRSEGL